MRALSAQSMADLLTLPYGRGGEVLEVRVGADDAGFTIIPPYDFKEFRARYDEDPPQPKYIVFPKTKTGRDSLRLLVEYSLETTLLTVLGPTTGLVAPSSTDGFPGTVPFNIRIENEVMTVTAFVGARWRVTRGVEGTASVAHDRARPIINIQTAALDVPAKTFAGTSFAIPTPALARSNLRLRRFRQSPVGLPGAGANNWGFVALLGNISKLLWVLGWEKDNIRHHLEDTQLQRHRAASHAFSLDLLGQDLNVPRFPPREHSFDSNTVALYHLNDDVPDNGKVIDEITRFSNLPGHPGLNKNARSGAAGRFGKAFSFPGTGASGSIEITSHADFNVAANGSFTVEALVNADDRNDLVDTTPRIVIMRRNRESADPLLTVPGWSLSVGSFRGIANNVMWAVSDGTAEMKIFADLNIADSKFHHLAGIIDRESQRCRLVVDGQERANADISSLGAIVNGELVRIGRSSNSNQFSGEVDEVRLSRVARADFHPVLGEGDDAYRQRLGIFERWLLPTPENLLATINSLVQINGQTDSFVLRERNRPTVTASRVLRILPVSLPGSTKIDRDGNLRSDEADVSGRPAEDTDFKDIYLFVHNRPEIDYGADHKNHLMQGVTKTALDALVDLLVAAAVSNKLVISRSFQPTGDGLHRVGRALQLKHQSFPLEQLGVLAHRAGFDFVQNQGTAIHASVAPGEKLEIAPRNTVAPSLPPIDLFVGRAMDLRVAPESLPSNGQIKWTLIPCGAGRAHFEKFSTDPPNLPTPLTSRAHLSLAADAPGEITARIEYTLQGNTTTGTRTFLISIAELKDKTTIAANGAMNVTEAETTGRPGSAINEIYLITSSVAVNFGADSNNKRMHLGLEQALKRLVTIITAVPAAGNQLEILKAYDPAGPGLHPTGRAIRFRHAALGPGPLGALAHEAGFGFVLRDGNEVYCSVQDSEKIEIARGDLTPLPDELTVNSPANLLVRFTDLPASAPFSLGLGFQAELDNGAISNALKQEFASQGVALSTLASVTVEQAGTRWNITDVGRKFFLVKAAGKINVVTLTGNYNWSIDSIGNGRASLGVVVRPQATITPSEPGLVSLNVTYLESDPQGTVPYSLEIRLKDALNVPQTVIAKHEYDLLMNVLNYFHPIGVEVITQNVREHVVEIKGDLLNAFPGYTYPNFRG